MVGENRYMFSLSPLKARVVPLGRHTKMLRDRKWRNVEWKHGERQKTNLSTQARDQVWESTQIPCGWLCHCWTQVHCTPSPTVKGSFSVHHHWRTPPAYPRYPSHQQTTLSPLTALLEAFQVFRSNDQTLGEFKSSPLLWSWLPNRTKLQLAYHLSHDVRTPPFLLVSILPSIPLSGQTEIKEVSVSE